MKQQTIDLVADGATQQWSFTGASAAWESCLRGSGDASYIHDDTLGQVVDLVVAPGSSPAFGFVSAVILHYRVSCTVVFRTYSVRPSITYSGNVSTGSSYSPTDTTWQDKYQKFTGYNFGAASRFSAADLADFQVSFEITGAPVAGEFRISECWLELEFCDSPYFYDPLVSGATPDSLVGDRVWSTAGTEASAIASDQLEIQDMSAVDFRSYSRGLEAYRHPTTTEICADLMISNLGVTPTPTCVFRIAQVDDGTRSVWVTVVQSSLGDWYLGLTGAGLTVDDDTTYIATSLLTAAEQNNYMHVAVTIDRNEDPGNPGLVEVKLNHVVRLTANYRAFPGITTRQMGFGTGDATHLDTLDLVAVLNFWSWRHDQSAGQRFPGWERDVGYNNDLVANSTDYAIVRPRAVPGPYLGQQVGQSNYCCELVARDGTQVCSVYQLWKFPDTTTAYNLFIDYRVTVFGVIAEVLVQNTRDLAYWDQPFGGWAAAETSTTLPAATTRQYGYAAMTNLLTGLTNDGLLIRIRTLGGAPAHSVMIYKVLLKPA